MQPVLRKAGTNTKGALVAFGAKGGFDAEAERQRRPRIAEVPFDAAHKYMATFHWEGDAVRVFVKGAPDVEISLNLGDGLRVQAAAVWDCKDVGLAATSIPS